MECSCIVVHFHLIILWQHGYFYITLRLSGMKDITVATPSLKCARGLLTVGKTARKKTARKATAHHILTAIVYVDLLRFFRTDLFKG